VAQKVAESQAEGGFLGIGGRDISAGEIQALKDIAGKLGYDTGAGSDWSQRIIVPTNTYRAHNRYCIAPASRARAAPGAGDTGAISLRSFPQARHLC